MVGSLNPNMQDKREKTGFGLNLSTLLDLASIVGDTATGNLAGAGTGLAGFVDDASGGKVFDDKQRQLLDLANMGTSLSGLLTNPAKGADAAKIAMDGFDATEAVVKGGNAVASIGDSVKALDAVVGADAALKGGDLANMVAKGGNTAKAAGAAPSLLAQAGNADSGMDLATMISQASPELMKAAAQKGVETGFSLEELMTKLQKIKDSPGMGMAEDAIELGQLYTEMTKGPAAPGMASGGGGFVPGTVAEQFMSRS